MRRFFVALLMFITSVHTGLAQYVSDGAHFEVNEISGCAPLTVNVIPNPGYECNGGTPCDIGFESLFPNPDVPANQLTYTYTQPGTYILWILYSGGRGIDQITIEVRPDIPPDIQIFKCSSNGVELSIPDVNYDNYAIDYDYNGTFTPDIVVARDPSAKYSYTFGTSGPKQIAVKGIYAGAMDNCTPTIRSLTASASLGTPTIDQLAVLDQSSVQLNFGNREQNTNYKLEIQTNTGSFQSTPYVINNPTLTVTGLNTDANYYCFRLGAYDPCSNATTYSNTICSADLDATAVNNANALTWSTHSAGVGFYTFSRTPSFPIPVSRPGSESTLSDTDVQCNVEYCYQMTTRYSNGSQSISLSKCVTAISDDTPPITDDISILVTGPTTLDVVWTQDPMYTPSEYTFYKGGAAYGKSDMAFFTDNSFILNAGDCYAVSYVDACGNASPVSKTVCPIILTGDLQSDNTVDIAWNAYTGWANGVDHYMLEKYSHDGQLLGSFNTGTSTTYPDDNIDLDNQVVIYRVIAYPVGGVITESISNDVTIIREPHIYHPTAFTPNNDGLNDTFEVHSMFTAQVEFMVFNRWGEMLFYTTDLNQRWDGTYKGSVVPEGTYVFRAFLTDQTGKQYERAGNVVLLRKK